MANRADVAKLANVSVATVTNALTGRKPVGADLRERVLAAAQTLKYIPDSSAQRLASGINKHIGVAVSELTNPYHIEVIKGIDSYAAEQDFAVSVFDLDNNAQNKFKLIASRRLGGVVNFVSDTYPDEYVRYFIQDNVVMVNFECEQSFRIDAVYSDGMDALVRKAAELGHKNAAILSTLELQYMLLDSRAAKFIELREQCGFNTDDGLLVGNDLGGKRTSEEMGYLLTKKLLASGKKFTVLFCINDMSALGAITALHESGIRVPDDISVVGCDDISICKYVHPSLTTLGFDKFAYGRQIAKTIIDKIKNPDMERFVQKVQASPVFRNSLGKAKT